MEEIILSILIPTLPSRGVLLKSLLKELKKQCSDYMGTDEQAEDGIQYCFFNFKHIQIITALDDEKISIGRKRHKILHKSEGQYICFIDDDDHIMPNYISDILKALESKPDCVGFAGFYTVNGGNRQDFQISKRFGKWYTENNIHYRTPNHLSPVKKSIAIKAGFSDRQRGEDSEYSYKILPNLKTEVYIPSELYHYDSYPANSKTK